VQGRERSIVAADRTPLVLRDSFFLSVAPRPPSFGPLHFATRDKRNSCISKSVAVPTAINRIRDRCQQSKPPPPQVPCRFHVSIVSHHQIQCLVEFHENRSLGKFPPIIKETAEGGVGGGEGLTKSLFIHSGFCAVTTMISTKA